MTILDTFYLSFKSQGTSQAKKDVTDLDQQIEQLAVKGSKRTQEETKNLGVLRRQRQLAIADLRDTTKQTNDLNDSFVRMGAAVGGVVTAYLGWKAIKSELVNSAQATSNLAVQSQWLEQNAADLAGWGNAAKVAGGTAEGLKNSIKNLHDTYVKAGIPFPSNPFEALLKVAKQWKDLNLTFAQKQQAGLKLGLDDGTILLLSKGPEAIQKMVEQQQKILNLTKADTDAARQLSIAWDNVGTSVEGLANKINTKIAPVVTKIFDLITKFSSGMSEFIGSDTPLFSLPWNANKPSSAPSGNNSSNKQKIIDFWKSKGFSDAQAGGWAANAQAESSFNPAANNGSHGGLYQWSASRRAKILSGLGVDVWKAGLDDQLRAAAWEANSMGITPGTLPAETGAAAGAISNKFEVPSTTPLGLLNEANKRANIARGYFVNSPLNSSLSQSSGKSVNVDIGDITVNTQATDAKGVSRALTDRLKSDMRSVISNFDDGLLA